MCKDISGGPVCVRACPVGAALRVKPEELLNYAGGTGNDANLINDDAD
jgi:ferredoxin